MSVCTRFDVVVCLLHAPVCALSAYMCATSLASSRFSLCSHCPSPPPTPTPIPPLFLLRTTHAHAALFLFRYQTFLGNEKKLKDIFENAGDFHDEDDQDPVDQKPRERLLTCANDKGASAYDLALRSGRNEIITLLRRYGGGGFTKLMSAIDRGSQREIEVCLRDRETEIEIEGEGIGAGEGVGEVKIDRKRKRGGGRERKRRREKEEERERERERERGGQEEGREGGREGDVVQERPVRSREVVQQISYGREVDSYSWCWRRSTRLAGGSSLSRELVLQRNESIARLERAQLTDRTDHSFTFLRNHHSGGIEGD